MGPSDSLFRQPGTSDNWHPGMDETGRQILARMRENPHAPLFRNQSGHRLLPSEIQKWQAEANGFRSGPVHGDPDHQPRWLDGFLKRLWETCPYYKDGPHSKNLRDYPTIHRGHFSNRVTDFVPDDLPLDRLIQFSTTGTTGHPLVIPSHPVVAARYLAFHQRALARFGVELPRGPDRIGVILVGCQKKCFTYTSITPTLGGPGLAKINLHPNDWRRPEDRGLWLDAMAADLYTGDPISLSALAELATGHRPLALLSTGMHLNQALQEKLAERFAAPVLDIYSMNEAGPLAVFDPRFGGHVLLQPQMFVEILDDAGQRMPAGQRGEITLTGGFNDYLPLCRYRTGDFASIELVQGEWVLKNLEGRLPVRFQGLGGLWHNNIEITHALAPLPLVRFSAHQDARGHLTVKFQGLAVPPAQVADSLKPYFGNQVTAVPSLFEGEDKVRQYTSDLPGACQLGGLL